MQSLATDLPVLALWHPLMWEVYRPGTVEPFYTTRGWTAGSYGAEQADLLPP